MNKKVRQLRIAKVLEHSIATEVRGIIDSPTSEPKYFYRVHQDSPNTMVELWPMRSHREQTALGFSKVNWPDAFDSDYGVEMALAKAAAKLVKMGYDEPKIQAEEITIEMITGQVPVEAEMV